MFNTPVGRALALQIASHSLMFQNVGRALARQTNKKLSSL